VFLSRKKPPLLGLDISSTSVKLMELSKTGASYRIEGIGVEPLPANAVVEKNVAEIESVGESVKRALAKSKIKSKNCAIAVSGSSVITKKITMPATLSEDEMEGQIQLEADQYIPYPLEEVNLDFHVIGETETNPETVDVLSELTWTDTKAVVTEISTELMVRDRWLLHADIGWGGLDSGEFRDLDYCESGRRNMFSHTLHPLSDGDVFYLQLDIIYELFSNDWCALDVFLGHQTWREKYIASDGVEETEEGCLSVPGIFEKIHDRYPQ